MRIFGIIYQEFRYIASTQATTLYNKLENYTFKTTATSHRHQWVKLFLQLTLTDEQFMLDDTAAVTSLTDLCKDTEDTAQRLLNHYVKVQGLTISQVRGHLRLPHMYHIQCSAVITWSVFSVPLRSRHFLSQKLWHFHKDTCSCVENECCCPCTVNISNFNFT